MTGSRAPYPRLGYVALVFVGLTGAGFYRTYFSSLFDGHAALVHVHAVLMLLWLAALIVQPLLIERRQMSRHRAIGKLSYVVVPLLLCTALLMMRHGYRNGLAGVESAIAAGGAHQSREALVHTLRAGMLLPAMYFVWLLGFYVLAVIHRRRMIDHAGYMVAAALTLTGPTLDRILYFLVPGMAEAAQRWPIEAVAFLLIDLALVALFVHEYRHARRTRTIGIALGLYVAGQVAYFAVRNTAAWQSFVTRAF